MENPNTPPPLPFTQTLSTGASRGKPFAIASLVTAGIGVLPLLVYLVVCLNSTGYSYYYGKNILPALLMGFLGFAIHGVALILGIVGVSLGAKGSGLIGIASNALILFLIMIFGVLAMS